MLEVEDALFRIIEKCRGKKVTASISGGKDSAILYRLCHMAMERDPTLDITFVFVNTGMELIANIRWVKQHDDIIWLRPKIPMVKHIAMNGIPCVSKFKDDHIERWQKRSNENSKEMLLTGYYNGKLYAKGRLHKRYAERIVNTDVKISGKCCKYLKKDPIAAYEKENNIEVSMTGMRVAEGGARSLHLKSCFSVDRTGKTKLHPIYDWSDNFVEKFIVDYGVELSDAYNIYNMKRTGCVGCPYNRHVVEDLKILKEHEPKSYQKAMIFFKKSYDLKGMDVE